MTTTYTFTSTTSRLTFFTIRFFSNLCFDFEDFGAEDTRREEEQASPGISKLPSSCIIPRSTGSRLIPEKKQVIADLNTFQSTTATHKVGAFSCQIKRIQ
jgi:hypothetical protein